MHTENPAPETDVSLPYQDMDDYFALHPEEFSQSEGYGIRTVVLLLTAIIAGVLAYRPELINFTGIGFQSIFGIIALVCFLLAFVKSTHTIYRKTGNPIKEIHFRKFSLENANIEDIIEDFESGKLSEVTKYPASDDASLRVRVYADTKGKAAWVILINQYYGETNYVSPVLHFEGFEYDKHIGLLKTL